MKLIDARSGQVVNVKPLGRTVFDPPLVFDYGGGDSTTISEVNMGVMSGKARVTTSSAPMRGSGNAPPQVWSGWGDLSVRFTHPGFPFERVAFIPS
jgi:hypothetical protein